MAVKELRRELRRCRYRKLACAKKKIRLRVLLLKTLFTLNEGNPNPKLPQADWYQASRYPSGEPIFRS